MLNNKAKRIIESVYEAISAIGFMQKDIEGKTISLDKNKGIIKIQDTDGMRTLYTITIK